MKKNYKQQYLNVTCNGGNTEKKKIWVCRLHNFLKAFMKKTPHFKKTCLLNEEFVKNYVLYNLYN